MLPISEQCEYGYKQATAPFYGLKDACVKDEKSTPGKCDSKSDEKASDNSSSASTSSPSSAKYYPGFPEREMGNLIDKIICIKKDKSIDFHDIAESRNNIGSEYSC